MSAPVVGTEADGLARAVAVVRRGGVLVYPTETVYGLGGDPTHDAVRARVRALKGRDAVKPMLVLTDEWARVRGWIREPSVPHRRLMVHEPALPVTLLFEPSECAPEGLSGPGGQVGIRRTSDPFCCALIAEADRALLSTSANPAGEPAPRRFDEIDAALRRAVDLVVDAGRELAGVPSTVVRIQEGGMEVLREGAVSRGVLAAIAYGEN